MYGEKVKHKKIINIYDFLLLLYCFDRLCLVSSEPRVLCFLFACDLVPPFYHHSDTQQQSTQRYAKVAIMVSVCSNHHVGNLFLTWSFKRNQIPETTPGTFLINFHTDSWFVLVYSVKTSGVIRKCQTKLSLGSL